MSFGSPPPGGKFYAGRSDDTPNNHLVLWRALVDQEATMMEKVSAVEAAKAVRAQRERADFDERERNAVTYGRDDYMDPDLSNMEREYRLKRNVDKAKGEAQRAQVSLARTREARFAAQKEAAQLKREVNGMHARLDEYTDIVKSLRPRVHVDVVPEGGKGGASPAGERGDTPRGSRHRHRRRSSHRHGHGRDRAHGYGHRSRERHGHGHGHGHGHDHGGEHRHGHTHSYSRRHGGDERSPSPSRGGGARRYEVRDGHMSTLTRDREARDKAGLGRHAIDKGKGMGVAGLDLLDKVVEERRLPKIGTVRHVSPPPSERRRMIAQQLEAMMSPIKKGGPASGRPSPVRGRGAARAAAYAAEASARGGGASPEPGASPEGGSSGPAIGSPGGGAFGRGGRSKGAAGAAGVAARDAYGEDLFAAESDTGTRSFSALPGVHTLRMVGHRARRKPHALAGYQVAGTSPSRSPSPPPHAVPVVATHAAGAVVRGNSSESANARAADKATTRQGQQHAISISHLARQ